MGADPTQRFTSRVSDYARCRPSYPPALFDAMRDAGLAPAHLIADVGAGTGIFSRHLMGRGHAVLAVEPNAAMAAGAAKGLAAFPAFRLVVARAEATALAGGAVDAITAAQAFHWFDAAAFRAEARRILRGPRLAFLVWNNRRTDTPFLAAYEALLHEWSIDYAQVSATYASPKGMGTFFGGPYASARFPNAQALDFAGLTGRLRSSSYAPPKGHAKHAPMMDALRALFDRCADERGQVSFDYDTELYWAAVQS